MRISGHEDERNARLKGAQTTIEALRACGWSGDDLADLHGLDANEVELVIDHETYQGETHPKVKFVNRPSGLGLKAPMTLEQARAFAARMKGDVLMASRRIQPPAGAAPQRSMEGAGADDIPF